jgi:hypothetical protein
MLRNNAPGGVASQCVIHRIEVLGEAAPEPVDVATWEDDAGGNGAPIFEALRRKWGEVPLGLTIRRQHADREMIERAATNGEQRIERLQRVRFFRCTRPCKSDWRECLRDTRLQRPSLRPCF